MRPDALRLQNSFQEQIKEEGAAGGAAALALFYGSAFDSERDSSEVLVGARFGWLCVNFGRFESAP